MRLLQSDVSITQWILWSVLAAGTALLSCGPGLNQTDKSGENLPPKTAPGSFSISSIEAGDGQITLSWGDAENADSYVVSRGTTSQSYPTVVSNAAVSPYVDKDLTNGTTYFYMVSAVNEVGTTNATEEKSAAPGSLASIPGSFAISSSSAGDGQATLTWAASSGATSYTIESGTASGTYPTTVTSTSTTSHVVTGLTNGTTYYFMVVAENSVGTRNADAEVAVTPGSLPSSFAISSSSAGIGQATLTWAASSGATSYTVKSGTTSGTYPTTVTSTSTTSHVVTGLTNGTTYYFMVVAENSFGTKNADAEAAVTTAGNALTSWTFVDGGGATGLNKDTTLAAYRTRSTVFNSKLHVIWIESNGSIGQVRVKAYDGTSWSFIDGNGANGLNYNTAREPSYADLIVFNSKLYAIWNEHNGTARQVRVKEYNGTSWTFVDGNGANGLNKNATKHAERPIFATYNSKLYATWAERYSGAADQIRVMEFDGTSWTFVDGNAATGLNKDTTRGAANPYLMTYNSKLYAAWEETNGTNYQIRVKAFDGTTWSSADGNGTNGLNKDPTVYGGSTTLAVYNSKLYAMWCESNANSNVRVSAYDGTSWTFVDGNGTDGINQDPTEWAEYPTLTVFDSRLYGTWRELNGPYGQNRIKVYAGTSWTSADGAGVNGINKDPNSDAYFPMLTAFNSKLYAIWNEESTGINQVRVSVGN